MSKQQSWKQKTGLDVGDSALCNGLVKYKNKGYNIHEKVKILEIKTNACSCMVCELNGEHDVTVSILKKYLSKIEEETSTTISANDTTWNETVPPDNANTTNEELGPSTPSDTPLHIEDNEADSLANLLDTLPDERRNISKPVSDQTVIYKPKEVETVLTDKTKVINLEEALENIPLEKEIEENQDKVVQNEEQMLEKIEGTGTPSEETIPMPEMKMEKTTDDPKYENTNEDVSEEENQTIEEISDIVDEDEVDLKEETVEKHVGQNTIEFISGKVMDHMMEEKKESVASQTDELHVPSFFTEYDLSNELKEQIISYARSEAESKFPFKKLEELTLYFPLEYSLFHVKTGTRLVIALNYEKMPELKEYITHDTTSISVEVLFNEQTKTIHSYLFRRVRKNRFMKKLMDFRLSKKSEKELEKCVNECMNEYYILEEIDSKKKW